MSIPDLSRRDVLRGAVALGAGAAFAPASIAAEPVATGRKPAVRFAHLTDMHVDADPRRRGDLGFAAALRHVSALPNPPEFLITGGDHVYEGFAASRPVANRQWDAYAKVLAEGTKLPVHPVIGNHDVWGWPDDKLSPDEPGYGKALPCDRLGIEKPYYSFDRGGWHFVVIDNIARRGNRYFGGLDDAQAEWLKGDLRAAEKRPVCVISHIPILAACVLFDVDTRFKDDAWHIPDASVHRDPKTLIDLLKTANTRLCISGHIHLVDRVEYRGISFVCDGAVCGNWWKGPLQEFPEGYGTFDLYADGTFDCHYHAYGWERAKANG
ncbi:MAG TPA: metallophosphoesterase [Tepidisphaeraceae bacterium]|nr:metallophosphoesterase [Tepidisphaeraceae bacterium]